MRPRSRSNPGELAPRADTAPVELSEADALPILQSADVVGGYRIPWGSNYTFLVWIDAGPGKHLRAIYKPRDGERPLHDFPTGSLYKREYAAFLLSRDLGWPNVPLTLLREGPYGLGTVQLFVANDPNITYFDLIDEEPEELLRFAVFDLLVNNADRKAGHCLLGNDAKVWSIDHGLTFHPVFKLRTVMLEFWGKPIPGHLVDDVENLRAGLHSANGLAGRLAKLLPPKDLKALTKRLAAVVDDPALPSLDPYRDVPWPWV